MKSSFFSRGLLLASAVAVILTGCASPADRGAMTPQNLNIAKHHPYSLQVQTGGGSGTGAMESSNIADADLKAAIEAAVTQSKLFKTVVQGNTGDYELSVSVINLSKPMFGGTFTVDLETAWTLTKLSDRSVVWRKAVQSSGTATMGEALAGVTRLRLAVEKASSENIRQGLQAIGALSL